VAAPYILTDPLGAPLTVTIGGVVCLTASIVFPTQLPGIRAPMRRMIAEQREMVADK
jgi:hypothetical protein